MATGEAPFDAPRSATASVTAPRGGRIGEPGLVIDGRYRLEQLLGAGGFGEVWKARQEVEGAEIRPVALKLLYAPDTGTGTPALSTGRTGASGASGSSTGGGHSWLDEVRAVRDVRCEAIATIFDVGISRAPRVAFIAMELLRGETLDQRLRRGNLHWRRALWIARRVAIALEACHKVDVVHCDLKPQNVFLGGEGEVYVLDFGVAALGGRTVARAMPAAPADGGFDPGATGAVSVDEMPGIEVAGGTMQIVGTPGYIAPENFLGDAPGPASDAFALGVLIYRAITGLLPHRVPPDLDPTSTRTTSTADGQQRFQAALHAATIRGDLVPLADALPGLPDGVNRLIASLLAPDPGQRPVRNLVGAIDDVLRRPWGVPDPPYVGLASFDARRAGYISGRDGDIEEVTAVLRRGRVVVLAGPSGCGKSSLAIAGVAARVDQELLEGADGWDLVTLRPSQGHAVLRSAGQVVASSPAHVGTVVVIDQMEEVIRLDEQARTAFCIAFAELAEGTGAVEVAGRLLRMGDPVRLIATVRDDLFGRVAALPELRRIPERNLFTVRGVEPNAMTEIVEGPARAAGFTLEGGHDVVIEATRIVGEDPGALPLVQFALTRWWEARDPERRVLPRQVWVDIGGIEGALAEAAQTLYDSLDDGERAAMRSVLLALFRPDGTRVRAPLAGLVTSPTTQQVLARLIDRRLVTRHTEDEGGATLEVVHEALGRRWPLLHQWLEETRAERELLHDVRYDAERWRKAGKPADLLWRGGRLAAVVELRDRLGDAGEFVTASQQMKRGQAWKSRGVAGLILAIVAVAVVVTLSYLASNRERRKADEAKKQAEDALVQVEDAKKEVETALSTNITLRKEAEDSRNQAMDQKREADEQRTLAEQERARAQREADSNAELRRQA